MGLSSPRQQFSVHSVTPYALADKTIAGVDFKKGQPFGLFQIVGDCVFNYAASSVMNRGGSSLFPWASEVTEIDTESTLTIKESPDMLFSLFGGASISKTAASSTGSIVALKNVKGTSVLDASTGIATATIKSGSETDLRFNVYIVKAVSTTTVDVYAMTDLEFARVDAAADLSFVDDTLKITSSALTIVASTAVTVPNSGVELTGGSGVIGMTVGDTAVYKTVAAHGGISTISLGKKGLTFPEFGLILYSKPRSDSFTMQEIELYKVKASAGMPVTLPESDFQVFDLTITALINNAPLDGSGLAKLAEIRSVSPA